MDDSINDDQCQVQKNNGVQAADDDIVHMTIKNQTVTVMMKSN